MNQKHCRGCQHLDFNEMSDEMYCKLKDYELIRLRWHKHRPDWCSLVTGAEMEETMKIGDRCFVHGYIDEIRKDMVIIRNTGGYFGTDPGEVITVNDTAHPNWISLEDRFPDNNMDVLL